jgi:hypothetical protein
MTLDQYKQAKFIREQIDHLKVKRLQIHNMKKREEDKEFNTTRELAYDAIDYSIKRLEEDFNNL